MLLGSDYSVYLQQLKTGFLIILFVYCWWFPFAAKFWPRKCYIFQTALANTHAFYNVSYIFNFARTVNDIWIPIASDDKSDFVSYCLKTAVFLDSVIVIWSTYSQEKSRKSGDNRFILEDVKLLLINGICHWNLHIFSQQGLEQAQSKGGEGIRYDHNFFILPIEMVGRVKI